MLFKKAKQKWDKTLFEHPTGEYRARPFWAWNNELTAELLEEQIRAFSCMGFGGFFMHARIGLKMPYLSEKFFAAVQTAVSAAQEQGLEAWIYDEDRYPSGFAGGKVTETYRFRYKMLILSRSLPSEHGSVEELMERGMPCVLGCYDVDLGAQGELLSYQKVPLGAPEKGQRWYAYLITQKSNAWYNGQTYIDTLIPESMERFLEITHEAYKEHIGRQFSQTVPGVFTDEPQPLPGVVQSAPLSGEDVSFAWTVGLEDQFEAENGFSLLEKLPELVWELPQGQYSRTRYCYRKLISDRFYTGYFVPYAAWCRRNGLLFTGHLQDENSLSGQTRIMGEAMRHYKAFDIPGIDLLCDNIEFCTAKQAQSVAHQYGKEGVASELYGTTNWDFDFRRHKFQGDWQAALGVILRVPHLAWLSMEGPAKRDYPASIGMQSPWYREYSYLEDHFSRVNTSLSRGKPVVKIGVIHPVESAWMIYGNRHDTALHMDAMQRQFEETTQWLLYGKQDFDFISEALLPELFSDAENGILSVGEGQYEAVIVPNCLTLRHTTVDILRRFARQGGRLIFLGELPHYMDASPSDEPMELAQRAVVISHDEYALLHALEPLRQVELLRDDGTRENSRIYQLRQDGADKWLFIAQGKKTEGEDVIHPCRTTLRIRGTYTPLQCDTLTGAIIPLPYRVRDGWTEIPHMFYQQDSLLLRLMSSGEPYEEEKPAKEKKRLQVIRWQEPVSVKREEDNVFLLDMAEWKLDEEPWHSEEELLRIDRSCRRRLGYPMRGTIQPWTLPCTEEKHDLRLRFTIRSKIELSGLWLGSEAGADILWNGEAVPPNSDGFYVDRAIRRIHLPKLKKGINCLELTIPFTMRDGPENLYLLGDFDVEVRGCKKAAIPFRRKYAFGNAASQGMPFYGGNLRYCMDFESKGESAKVSVWHYRGAVIKAFLDGAFAGYIAFEPYQLYLPHIGRGKHRLELVLYGTRINTFGSVHNADTSVVRFGPPVWQTEQSAWSYEYRLKETGILSSPIIEVFEE